MSEPYTLKNMEVEESKSKTREEESEIKTNLLEKQKTSSPRGSCLQKVVYWMVFVAVVIALCVVVAIIVRSIESNRNSPSDSGSSVVYVYNISTALVNVTLIDGNGGSPLSQQTILITETGTIADIFPTGSQPIPTTALIYDLSGRFVIPGLIDSHVHLETAYDPANFSIYLTWALKGGITSVRDMAGNVAVLISYSAQALIPSVPYPRIYYISLWAGPQVMEDERFIADAGGFPVGSIPWVRLLNNHTEVLNGVREAIQIGAIAVKVYGNVTGPYFSSVTQEVHRQGLKMYAHATVFPAKPSQMVEAGVDSLSHAQYLVWEASDPTPYDYNMRKYYDYNLTAYDSPIMKDLLTKMKNAKTILDPTLTIFLLDDLLTSTKLTYMGLDNLTMDPNIGVWGANITRLANEMGIRICAGTDNLGSPFDNDTYPWLHTELENLVNYSQFTPLQAITAATRTGAEVLGVEKDFGTIEKGKVADLLVLTDDPSVDIRHTKNILYVMKQGAIYSP